VFFGLFFHNSTTFAARSQGLAVVKVGEMRQEIGLDVVQFKVHFVQFMVAIVAMPKQAIGEAFACPFSFNHQPNGVF
jgi:hypothetical protein